MKITTARTITLILVLASVVAGLIFHTGSGTPSSFGWSFIASVCPLGAIETMLAGKVVVLRVLAILIIIAAVSLILGKVFCAWVCPVPPLRNFFRRRIRGHGTKDIDKDALFEDPPKESACASSCTACAEKRRKLDSRHIVLGGTLLSAAIFGFPVFCLICPVGLTFGTLIAFWRLIGFNEPSWMLLVFPAIIFLEVLVLRRWCLKWCPLGAVMSLLSIPNRFFKPKVDESLCLRNKGMECSICVKVCPERLDPHFSVGMHECTKCGLCKENCPASAISIPFNPRKNNRLPAGAMPSIDLEDQTAERR